MNLSLIFFAILIWPHGAAPGWRCVGHDDASTQNKSQSSCWDQATTQFAMNECAGQEQKQADAELNKTYQQVLTKYANDPQRLDPIKNAERAWLAFRDAEIEALFPEDRRPERGSVYPMCRALHLARLTQERTKALKALLEWKEGDVCAP